MTRRNAPLPFGWLIDSVVYLDRHEIVQESLDIGGEYSTEAVGTHRGSSPPVGLEALAWEWYR
jgi:hypothetical protein